MNIWNLTRWKKIDAKFRTLTWSLNLTLLGFIVVCLPNIGAAAGSKIDDADIRLAVESALFADDQIPENKIDVQVEDGIVVLSGTVSNLLAQEHTVQTVETLKGVRAIVNNISVDPVIPSDQKLKKAVINALLIDPATDSYEVSVTAEAGVVTLKGQVESWQEKQLSEKVAKGVKGVKRVNNQLVWVPESSRLDGEIQADVNRRLELDPWVAKEFVTVEVKDGRVFLSGSVGSLKEKRHVRAVAWVSGVREVNDEELKVQWWLRDDRKRELGAPVASDTNIRDAIKDAFLYDPRVNMFTVGIEVDDGSVTLTGVVDNAKAKQSAEEDARNTMGVWHVRNFIKVRPRDDLEDETIANNVEIMLALDPFLESKEIGVSVLDGHTYLTGSVDYAFEKKRAEEIAQRTNGVTQVANYIEVDRQWTRRADLEIRRDIEDELWWSPFVDSDQVTVTVEDGVATLTGEVDSWMERFIAEENAMEGGAKEVNNRIQIRPLGGNT